MTRVPPPGAHGGDGPAVAAALGLPPEGMLDLSASLNPAAPSPVRAIGRHLDSVHAYPDPAAATSALAVAMGVDPNRLLLTNGGAEAITLLAHQIGGHVAEPEFSLHPRGTDGPLWRSNPHSPTGLLAAADDRAGVWDESFYPLATGAWSRSDPAVPVVGSLTKLLRCPGLRAGYLLADPDLVAQCGHRQPAWSVNGLVCAALPDLLVPVDLTAWATTIAALRGSLREILASFGLLARPSDANWLLVDAPGLRDVLAPRGVLVRDCTGFGLPGVVRIAVPDADGLERVEAGLHDADRAGQLEGRPR